MQKLVSFITTLCLLFNSMPTSTIGPVSYETEKPLVCTEQEHAHEDSCYENGTLVCTIEEHQHTEDCYKAEMEEPVITEDEEPVSRNTAGDPINPYSTKTLEDYGGDYSLYYILNNFNLFVNGDATSGHCIGPAAVRGVSNFSKSMGTPGYTHTTPTYFEGLVDFSFNNGMTPMEVYVGEINADNMNVKVWDAYPRYTSKDDRYIDFDAAFAQIEDELEAISKNPDVIDVDFDKPVGEHYKIYPVENAGFYQIDVDSGYAYNFLPGLMDHLLTINVVGETGDAVIICEESGKVNLPNVNLNGYSDWNNVLPEGANIEYGADSGIVLLFPNATSFERKNGVRNSNGHLVAPNAVVDCLGGDKNGSTICKTYNCPNTESHMWPYHGKIIRPTGTKLEAEKTVDGLKPTGQQVFEFKLEQVKGPEGVAFIKPQTVTNDGAHIEFSNITYNKEGTYEYTITEIGKASTTTGSFTLDKSVYTAKVVVVKEEKTVGTVKITSYKVESVTYELNGKEVQGAKFDNKTISEKTKIEGKKTWEDNNDQDGKRPQS
ncbi:MAG: hypothetical protein HUJ58_03790, partial [Erysipelotrichaceae bacterium]|nr:hypothetical protein [Erysipelotrichaceae bacterium]